MPLKGDVADLYFRAHLRNLKLLQRELGEPFVNATIKPQASSRLSVQARDRVTKRPSNQNTAANGNSWPIVLKNSTGASLKASS